MSLETVSAHWQDTFERLVGNIQEYGLFVSPYITSTPIELVVQVLQGNPLIQSRNSRNRGAPMVWHSRGMMVGVWRKIYDLS
jgi:hypothetical protein